MRCLRWATVSIRNASIFSEKPSPASSMALVCYARAAQGCSRAIFAVHVNPIVRVADMFAWRYWSCSALLSFRAVAPQLIPLLRSTRWRCVDKACCAWHPRANTVYESNFLLPQGCHFLVV